MLHLLALLVLQMNVPVARSFSSEALHFSPAPLEGRVAVIGETLQLEVEAHDQQVSLGDLLTISLHFPGTGPLAAGVRYRFSSSGPHAADPPPEPSKPQAVAQILSAKGAMKVRLVIPFRALPPFPARGSLDAEVCLTYLDEEAGARRERSNCKSGRMDAPLRLPAKLRAAAVSGGLLPPRVQTLEGRRGGWVGDDEVGSVVWVRSDRRLGAADLAGFIAMPLVAPEKARLALRPTFQLPDGRRLHPVLWGKDPFREGGACGEGELRLGVYLIKERAAEQVLNWPVVTCALGRAVAVSLDEEGMLTIGYANGAVLHFIWSEDHFERTELG